MPLDSQSDSCAAPSKSDSQLLLDVFFRVRHDWPHSPCCLAETGLFQIVSCVEETQKHRKAPPIGPLTLVAVMLLTACSGPQNAAPLAPSSQPVGAAPGQTTSVRQGVKTSASAISAQYPLYTKPFSLITLSSTSGGKTTSFARPLAVNPVSIYPGPGGLDVQLLCSSCQTNYNEPIYWSVYQQGSHVSAQVLYQYVYFPEAESVQLTVTPGFCPVSNTSDSIQFTTAVPYPNNGTSYEVVNTLLPITILTEPQCQTASSIPGNIFSQASLAFQNGESTSAGPPCYTGGKGGTCACAWEVNRILVRAGLQPIGINPDYVPSVETALKSGRGQAETQGMTKRGDIAIQGNQGHMGICAVDGCAQAYSNSTKHSAFVDTSGPYFWDSVDAPRFYRVQN
jgi:hypothetical protein